MIGIESGITHFLWNVCLTWGSSIDLFWLVVVSIARQPSYHRIGANTHTHFYLWSQQTKATDNCGYTGFVVSHQLPAPTALTTRRHPKLRTVLRTTEHSMLWSNRCLRRQAYRTWHQLIREVLWTCGSLHCQTRDKSFCLLFSINKGLRRWTGNTWKEWYSTQIQVKSTNTFSLD